MEIVDKKPVPIYETICDECKSTIRYKKAEVRLGSYITCPVCGMPVWACCLCPIEFEEG